MKRDLDYIRELLFDAEKSDQQYILSRNYIGMTAEKEKHDYHAKLLCDAGYFKEDREHIYRLTNQGHDYLGAIRDDTIWSKTKKKLEPVGSVSLEIVKQVATGFVVDLIT